MTNFNSYFEYSIRKNTAKISCNNHHLLEKSEIDRSLQTDNAHHKHNERIVTKKAKTNAITQYDNELNIKKLSQKSTTAKKNTG